jgi:hypothetical protein
MFKWITNYRKKNKEKNEKEQYISGFDYAAGKLLRKELTPHELEDHIMYIDCDPFDYGIIAAITKLKEIDFITLGFIDDEYIK